MICTTLKCSGTPLKLLKNSFEVQPAKLYGIITVNLNFTIFTKATYSNLSDNKFDAVLFSSLFFCPTEFHSISWGGKNNRWSKRNSFRTKRKKKKKKKENCSKVQQSHSLPCTSNANVSISWCNLQFLINLNIMYFTVKF